MECFGSSGPMFPVGAAPRKRCTQHKGRLRRAYKSAFCQRGQETFPEICLLRAHRCALLHRHLFGKAFLDHRRRRTWDSLLRTRQRDRFIVVSFRADESVPAAQNSPRPTRSPARPFPERPRGERTMFFMEVASASKSRSSTSSPHRPSSTAFGIPPWRVARTASPVAIASRMELGMPSWF